MAESQVGQAAGRGIIYLLLSTIRVYLCTRMARKSEIILRPTRWEPNIKDELKELADAANESMNRYAIKILSCHIKKAKQKSQTKTVGNMKT
jgi:hypothetical protein